MHVFRWHKPITICYASMTLKRGRFLFREKLEGGEAGKAGRGCEQTSDKLKPSWDLILQYFYPNPQGRKNRTRLKMVYCYYGHALKLNKQTKKTVLIKPTFPKTSGERERHGGQVPGWRVIESWGRGCALTQFCVKASDWQHHRRLF